MSFFDSLKDQGNYEQRKVAKDALPNGLTVSTANTSDEGYETAILDANGAHSVERYESREEAVQGHAKWLEQAIPNTKVTKLGWLGLVDSEEIQLLVENQEEPLENRKN